MSLSVSLPVCCLCVCHSATGVYVSLSASLPVFCLCVCHSNVPATCVYVSLRVSWPVFCLCLCVFLMCLFIPVPATCVYVSLHVSWPFFCLFLCLSDVPVSTVCLGVSLPASHRMESVTMSPSLAEVSVHPVKLCSLYRRSISSWSTWRCGKSHCKEK